MLICFLLVFFPYLLSPSKLRNWPQTAVGTFKAVKSFLEFNVDNIEWRLQFFWLLHIDIKSFLFKNTSDCHDTYVHVFVFSLISNNRHNYIASFFSCFFLKCRTLNILINILWSFSCPGDTKDIVFFMSDHDLPLLFILTGLIDWVDFNLRISTVFYLRFDHASPQHHAFMQTNLFISFFFLNSRPHLCIMPRTFYFL